MRKNYLRYDKNENSELKRRWLRLKRQVTEYFNFQAPYKNTSNIDISLEICKILIIHHLLQQLHHKIHLISILISICVDYSLGYSHVRIPVANTSSTSLLSGSSCGFSGKSESRLQPQAMHFIAEIEIFRSLSRLLLLCLLPIILVLIQTRLKVEWTHHIKKT